jgi:hypothetical protein
MFTSHCKQVGRELNHSFGGKAYNLVIAANGSAIALMHMITNHFPGKSITGLHYMCFICHFIVPNIWILPITNFMLGCYQPFLTIAFTIASSYFLLIRVS